MSENMFIPTKYLKDNFKRCLIRFKDDPKEHDVILVKSINEKDIIVLIDNNKLNVKTIITDNIYCINFNPSIKEILPYEVLKDIDAYKIRELLEEYAGTPLRIYYNNKSEKYIGRICGYTNSELFLVYIDFEYDSMPKIISLSDINRIEYLSDEVVYNG